MWCSVAEAVSGPVVEVMYGQFDIFCGDEFECHLLREELANQHVHDLVGTALPRSFQSPILANVLLDEVDKALEKRRHRFAQYADDCNVYGLAKLGLIERQFMVSPVQTAEGLPIGHEVHPGNTAEAITLLPKLRGMLARYPLKRVALIADRGLLSGNGSIVDRLKPGFTVKIASTKRSFCCHLKIRRTSLPFWVFRVK